MATWSSNFFERIHTRNIPDLKSFRQGERSTLESQAFILIKLLATVIQAVIFMALFIQIFRKPIARIWACAAAGVSFFAWLGMPESPTLALMDKSTGFGAALGYYTSATLLTRETVTEPSKDHEPATSRSSDRGSSGKSSAPTFTMQIPNVLQGPAGPLLYILAMLEMSALVCEMVVYRNMPELSNGPQHFDIPLAIFFLLYLAILICSTVGYVWSTDALVRECSCALLGAAACFTCFRLSSDDGTWQARGVDGALTFPLMVIGLAYGFFTKGKPRLTEQS